jgi:hypothetical protein
MSKKSYILIAVALAFAGVYVVCFTGWFQPKVIKISDASRPIRSSRTGAATDQVFFRLNDYYSLTEVKVVPLAEFQTNKFALPVWHLVSDEGSDDVDQFFYGERIRGMDAAVSGVRPGPLQPGVTYRLFVAAGKIKGQIDFHLGPAPANPAANP